MDKNKINKNVEHLCKQLEKLGHVQEASEFFKGSGLVFREQLKDIALTCLFDSNYDQYKEIDFAVWRKAFYEPIQLLKRDIKKYNTKSVINEDIPVYWLLKSFLHSSMGHYQHVLMCCQLEPQGLNLRGKIDVGYHFDFSTFLNNSDSIMTFRAESTSDQLKIQSIVHQTLIYLGDLARYYADLDKDHSSFNLASRYYHQAILLSPDLGMPHSQLGTLFNAKFEGISSIFHYMNCTMSNQSFDGAHANLRQVFERIRPIHTERMTQPEKYKGVSNMMVKFVYLLDAFYNEDLGVDQVTIQGLCQEILSQFSSFLPTPSVLSSENILDHRIVFQMAALCFMIVTILQNTGSGNLSLAIAFAVGFCTYIINQAVTNLQMGLQAIIVKTYERRIGESIDETLAQKPKDEPCGEEGNIIEESKETSVKVKKRSHRTLRRRFSSENLYGASNSDLSSLSSSSSEAALKSISTSSLSSNAASLDKTFPGLATSERYISDYEEPEQATTPAKEGKESLDIHDVMAQPNVDGHKPATDGEAFEKSNTSGTSIYGADLGNCLSQEGEGLGNIVETRRLIDDGKNHSSSPESDTTNANETTGESVKLLSQKGQLDDIGDLPNSPALGLNLPRPRDSQELGRGTANREGEIAMLNDIVEMVSGEGLMFSIKIFANWLHSHNEILALCSKSCQSMWNSFVTLLNTFPNQDHLKMLEAYQRLQEYLMLNVQASGDVIAPQQMPTLSQLCGGKKDGLCLREDLALYGFMPLRASQNHLLYDPSAYPSLDPKTETLIRIMQLREFGNYLSETKEIDVMYDCTTDQFFNAFTFRDKELQTRRMKAMAVNEKHTFDLATKIACPDGREHSDSEYESDPQDKTLPRQDLDSNDVVMHEVEHGNSSLEALAKKDELMRLMGNLRLKCLIPVAQNQSIPHINTSPEIDYSNATNVNGQELPPPYLVPDTHVLCEKLPLIKALLASHNFIIVLARSVLDLLDILKKESGRARKVTRWLESELRDGNKYLHVQADSEAVYNLKFGKDFDERDKKIRLLCDMIRCGKYFVSKGTTLAPGSVLALILTFDLPVKVGERFKKPSLKNVMEGLDLMDVVHFFGRWKQIKYGARWSDLANRSPPIAEHHYEHEDDGIAVQPSHFKSSPLPKSYKAGGHKVSGHHYYRKRQPNDNRDKKDGFNTKFNQSQP